LRSSPQYDPGTHRVPALRVDPRAPHGCDGLAARFSSSLHGFGDLQDTVSHSLKRRTIYIDAVDQLRRALEPHLLAEPDREIVRTQLEPLAGLDKVVINAMDTDPFQSSGKFRKVSRDERRRNNYGNRRTKEKRLGCGAIPRRRTTGKVLRQSIYNLVAQRSYRREFPYVDGRQPLGERGLLACEGCPMSEVVRIALANEVMFLQSSESVLKD